MPFEIHDAALIGKNYIGEEAIQIKNLTNASLLEMVARESLTFLGVTSKRADALQYSVRQVMNAWVVVTRIYDHAENVYPRKIGLIRHLRSVISKTVSKKEIRGAANVVFSAFTEFRFLKAGDLFMIPTALVLLQKISVKKALVLPIHDRKAYRQEVSVSLNTLCLPLACLVSEDLVPNYGEQLGLISGNGAADSPFSGSKCAGYCCSCKSEAK